MPHEAMKNPPLRILFVVMSAVHRPQAVDQLARVLAPHAVLLHHDFGQTPEFPLSAPNAVFVPEPRRTGWGAWGFSEGILHALEHALARYEFDYLQLLSPTCLPIKPLARLEAHLAASDRDAHFGAVDLMAETDALMSVGYRAFSTRNTLRFRVLRWLSRHYFSERSGVREVAGMWLRTGVATTGTGAPTPLARIALQAVRASSRPAIGRHVFDAGLRPHCGSVWFGARRAVVARLAERARDPRIRAGFSRIHLPEEFLFASLLTACSERPGPLLHLINTFDEANPRWFDEADFERLERSPAYFARKFRDDPEAPIRRRVLDELCRDGARVDSAGETTTHARS